MIERDKWKYHGLPGHFICADRCIFRLHTDVGKYKISTLGAMYDRGKDGFLSPPMLEIGCQRHYETMVFDMSNPLAELECLGIRFNEDGDPAHYDLLAEKMHDDMCLKYAKIQK